MNTKIRFYLLCINFVYLHFDKREGQAWLLITNVILFK